MPNFPQIRQQGARMKAQAESASLPTNYAPQNTKPDVMKGQSGMDANDTGYQKFNANGAFINTKNKTNNPKL